MPEIYNVINYHRGQEGEKRRRELLLHRRHAQPLQSLEEDDHPTGGGQRHGQGMELFGEGHAAGAGGGQDLWLREM